MKRNRVLATGLVAVFAYGIVVVASASAVTFSLAEWLVNGAPVHTELSSEISGELLLEDTKVPILGKAMVLCSGALTGWVGSNSLARVSEVLTLSGAAISTTPLSGEALVCTNQENCEEPLVWALGLGWEGETEFMEDSGTFSIVLLKGMSGELGYEIECMKTVIGAITDECKTGEGVAELTLEGTTLLGRFSEAFTELAGAKLANCTQGGAESGIVEGEGAFTVSGGGELTVSPESKLSFLLAEWLVNGVAAVAELLVETTGELLLEDTKVPLLGKAMVLCSGILTGWVGPNSLNWLSEVLTLSGAAISSTPLTGEALVCTNQENCEEPLVWPVGLPYENEAELMEDSGAFFADLLKGTKGEVGYEIECMKSVIGAITDECKTAESVAELTLEDTTLLEKISEAFTELAGAKLANCTQGGTETGIVEGEGNETLSGGGELTASSEAVVWVES